MSARARRPPLTTIRADDGTVMVTVARRTSFVPPFTFIVTVPATASTAVTVPEAANLVFLPSLSVLSALSPWWLAVVGRLAAAAAVEAAGTATAVASAAATAMRRKRMGNSLSGGVP